VLLRSSPRATRQARNALCYSYRPLSPSGEATHDEQQLQLKAKYYCHERNGRGASEQRAMLSLSRTSLAFSKGATTTTSRRTATGVYLSTANRRRQQSTLSTTGLASCIKLANFQTANMLSSSPPQSMGLVLDASLRRRPPGQIRHQQVRGYLYLPTSLTEVRLRLRQIFQKQRATLLRVVLKDRSWTTTVAHTRNRIRQWRDDAVVAARKYRAGSGFAAGTASSPVSLSVGTTASSAATPRTLRGRQRAWVQKKRVQWNTMKRGLRQRYDAQRASAALSKTKVAAARLRFQNGVASRFSRKLLQSKSKLRKGVAVWKSAIRKPVLITEYARKSWFDELGRPLTSTDPTGRFVNPWQSQTSDGVQSLWNILKWRRERFLREFREYGWHVFVPDIFLLHADKKHQHETFDSMARIASEQFPVEIPLKRFEMPEDPSTIRFTWLGHATCLVQSQNTTILTDPIFSSRAGPWQSIPVGMNRDVPLPCSVETLPETIDICLISHDHYDHLDRDSVRSLRHRVRTWIVPLETTEFLVDRCGVPPSNVVELEWWQTIRIPVGDNSHANTTMTNVRSYRIQDYPVHPARIMDVHHYRREDEDDDDVGDSGSIWITFCPTQHWASRTMFDRNFRLWGSFAVLFDSPAQQQAVPDSGRHQQLRQRNCFFFAGDTALPSRFPLFEQISDYVGRVDLCALPIGAYRPDYYMRDAHMDPYEAVHVHKKLQAAQSVGIHWGTFPLSEEPMDEPPQLLRQAATEANVDNFCTIPHGGTLDIRCGEVSTMATAAAAAAAPDEWDDETSSSSWDEEEEEGRRVGHL